MTETSPESTVRGYPHGKGRDAQLRWEIVDAFRRHSLSSMRLVNAFAAEHHLQQSDLQALVAIMAAEGTGTPLTPARLREHLGLSSAGTTYVVDRLERAGIVQRTNDHPTNRRMVQLRYTDAGMATAMDFFGPVGARTEALMGDYSAQELAVIHRFVRDVADSMHDHALGLGQPGPADSPGERQPGPRGG